jgi:4-oxalocrotonate tautomerase
MTMPMITLKLSSPTGTPDVARAAALATSLTARLLRKDPEVTAVALSLVSPELWFIAGRSLTAWDRAAFFLEVRITDGTNTADEKRAFVAEAFHGLAELLGDVHPESYVHVIDARGDAYGYGGMTQDQRRRA